jgi:hypothetical protein
MSRIEKNGAQSRRLTGARNGTDLAEDFIHASQSLDRFYGSEHDANCTQAGVQDED